MSLNTILATAPLTATGYHLKATGTALGQSLIWDNGTNVGIGNQGTTYTLDVSGTGRFTGALTGTSATFTGDLTIDTNTLYVDSTNNRVGIGRTDPTRLLDVSATGAAYIRTSDRTNSVNVDMYSASSGGGIGTQTNHDFILQTNNTQRLLIAASTGAATFQQTSTSAESTLSLTNLSTGSNVTKGSRFIFRLSDTVGTVKDAGYISVYPTTSNPNIENAYMAFSTRSDDAAPAERMRITSAGNVGIGVTPSNWSTGKTLEIGGSYPLALHNSNAIGNSLSLNAYYNGAWYYTATSNAMLYIQDSEGHKFFTNGAGTANTTFTPAERMRITSGGGVGIGATSVTGTTKLKVNSIGAVNGDALCFIDNGVYNAFGLYSAGADGYNGLACVMIMGKNTNNRSINAGGSINASGNDYAEYMTKAIEDNIAKGDVVGVNANGLLTNIFADAKSFVVKSTDPSYVGGDTWGNVDIIGKLPLEATDEEKAEYEAKLEVARAKVDRIAFSGQVPCNVYNANVGDYIIPIDDNGTIKGQAVTNPSFEQYQLSVGKVWKIMEDGRAWIAVKIG